MGAYGALIALSFIATIGGMLTLAPNAAASYPNVLGYRSLCTFAPAATLFCFAIAGISCVLRASLIKRRAMVGKPVFRAPAVAAVATILALAVAATAWFASVTSQYTDGPDTTTTATQ